MRIKRLFLILICSVSCARRQYISAEQAPLNREKSVCESSCTAKSSANGYCLTVVWESYPTETEFGQFVLKVSRANAYDGAPVSFDTDLQIELLMPSMGHGSSPVNVQRLDAGTYRVSQVFFSMPGDWEIRIHLNSADKSRDQAIIPYHF